MFSTQPHNTPANRTSQEAKALRENRVTAVETARRLFSSRSAESSGSSRTATDNSVLLKRAGFAWTAACVSLVGAAAAALGALTSALPLDAQYATFVLVALSVPGAWSFASDYAEATFGLEHFGVNFGVVCCAVGLLGLLQVYFVQLATESGTYNGELWGLTALCLATLAFPIALKKFG